MKRIVLSTDLGAAASATKIAIVQSRTNDFITERLLEGAIEELTAHGIDDVTVIEVAGAFEIVSASRIALDSGVDGVVALGVVIRGDTPHFDYIAGAVTNGLTQLAAKGYAVTFGILTVDSVSQATDRAGGALGNKGAQAAAALLGLLFARKALRRTADGNAP